MVFDMGRQRPWSAELEAGFRHAPVSDVRPAPIHSPPSRWPDGVRFQPPRVHAVEHRYPAQVAMHEIIFDIAYVGSSQRTCSGRCRSTPCHSARRSSPQNQDPTRAPSATPGANALPNDFLRPFPGYGNIRMYDYSGYGNYHALQTSVSRRFDGGFSFTGFWVWSKALGISNDDGANSVPNLSKEETRRLDYGLVDYDRPHNILLNAIYQLRSFTDNRALGYVINDWQLSGSYQWLSGRPYAVNFNIPGIGAANLTGTDGNPNARIVLTCDPGDGYSSDPYRQVSNPSCFAPPQPGSDGAESARFFVRQPAGQQPQPVDFEAGAARRPEPVRIPRRHVQRAEPHAVHGSQQHRELQEPDRSDDHEPPVRREREPHAAERVRNDQCSRTGARAADRDAPHVLVQLTGARERCSRAPVPKTPNSQRPTPKSTLGVLGDWELSRVSKTAVVSDSRGWL